MSQLAETNLGIEPAVLVEIYRQMSRIRAVDKAIQAHGAGGLSQDFPLAAAWAGIRTLRFADGPDEVHKNALARAELKRHALEHASAPESPLRRQPSRVEE